MKRSDLTGASAEIAPPGMKQTFTPRCAAVHNNALGPYALWAEGIF